MRIFTVTPPHPSPNQYNSFYHDKTTQTDSIQHTGVTTVKVLVKLEFPIGSIVSINWKYMNSDGCPHTPSFYGVVEEPLNFDAPNSVGMKHMSRTLPLLSAVITGGTTGMAQIYCRATTATSS